MVELQLWVTLGTCSNQPLASTLAWGTNLTMQPDKWVRGALHGRHAAGTNLCCKIAVSG